MDTKIGLGGKPKLSANVPMMVVDLKWRQPLNLKKFNADRDKALPRFCQQKDRLTALYPDMSEFMIQRKILRQCGGDLEHTVKSRTTEQSSAGDIIDILEEVSG
ncbi:hypothetical protein O181_070254 [Austropuccinia psidii MF-1]|uniref:Uncharacterized protein n=1 Tax=Austropuccinia psidii MF-1 TaxID=1389203 RepID=A0A9Q3F0W2_9BASI|nr:hypothetical protein [Austropuccinia psidii MF-1]